LLPPVLTPQWLAYGLPFGAGSPSTSSQPLVPIRSPEHGRDPVAITPAPGCSSSEVTLAVLVGAASPDAVVV
jgi:hypothetical protein